MRITTQMMHENVTSQLSSNLERLYDIQTQIASGKNYQNSSDSPSGASTVLQLRSTYQANEIYLDTANSVDLWISTNENALAELIDIGSSVHTLTNTAMPDTIGDGERAGIKAEIEGLLQQAVGAGNTDHEGKFIFNGYRIDEKPFEYDASTNTLDTSKPNDAYELIQRRIGPGRTVTLNHSGELLVKPLLEAMIDIVDTLDQQPFDRSALQNAMSGLDEAIKDLKNARTINGSRQREINAGIAYLEKTNIDIKSLLSTKEDVNMAEAASLLTQQEMTYQASLEVTRRAISIPSLFSYL